MDLKNKLVKERIYEAWAPKIKKHLEAKGIKNVSDAKLRNICEAAQVRKIFDNVKNKVNLFEDATLANTPGRGAFSFGNNPSTAADTTKGSGEHFDAMFGLFIDTFTNTVGFDLVPSIQMTKSNLIYNVIEPVYASGKLDATVEADMPDVFQVSVNKVLAPTALVVGTSYQVKTAFAGTNIVNLVFAGKDRAKNKYIFKLGTVNVASQALATLLDSPINGAGIYTDATNYFSFTPASISYVNAYVNFINGYAGAGESDSNAWSVNRSQGTSIADPMNRAKGESTTGRDMGLNKWSENIAAGTYNVKIGYTIEFLQDLAMEEGTDAAALAIDVISNEMEQNINASVIDKYQGLGWGHAAEINALTGLNLNLHLAPTPQAGTTTFLDERSVSRTMPIANGALSTTSNGDNLPAMQRRIISRLSYAGAAVGQRCKKGKANTALTNGRLSSAIQDIKSFQLSPFDNSLQENDNLYMVGTVRKMALYEDSMQEFSDTRISVGRKGTTDESGLKIFNYILAEKFVTVPQGTMAELTMLKSRLKVAAVGNNPQFNYLSFTITEGTAQSII